MTVEQMTNIAAINVTLSMLILAFVIFFPTFRQYMKNRKHHAKK
ncbi:MAG: hypothetical protein UX35_C0011G0015 [Microgenomates group bacterium GW2011_GWA1_46_15]|nr:MAG: hypothetical protein UX00_C0006G0021 [Microgenomates group bacterium GW2011_GWB1_45_17]KKU23071.1 MAG: hypothetical protein UX35_C0011G0015 [Microgenomates group bacterium GW2011_GWA1_46_15]KKU23726.1 MAG: hypothetical protein UX36_C0003G0026 [Microgenomates group bacterium GW2011_GWC1_46_15]